MNSKQLANVLVKILGLSILIHSTVGCISELFIQRFPISSLGLAVIGYLLIIKSQGITALLFKSDKE